MNKKLDILKSVYLGLVWASFMGLISFLIISSIMVWALSIILIRYFNPDYDLTRIIFYTKLILKIVSAQIIILISYIFYNYFNKNEKQVKSRRR